MLRFILLPSNIPLFLFPGKTQYSTEPAPQVLTIYRKINSVNPLNWIKVGREIAKKNADKVIFAYWMSFMAPCFGTIAKQIHKFSSSLCIGLIHNMIPHEKTILDKLFPGYFVNKMDAFVTLSKAVIKDIQSFDKLDKPKIFTPHPIYDHYVKRLEQKVALQQLYLSSDDKYVLFFGFIRSYKGLDLLLSAFSDERLRALPVKLIVAGEFYGNPEPYYQQIKDLHIENQVILHTDYIPDSSVNLYFSAADIVAQPYKTATQSGVTQIAFHFEKPMLVTNVGGLSEIVLDGQIGYVVEPDIKKIADALYDYFSTDKQALFESNLKIEKQKYSWNHITEAIGKLID